MRAAMMHPGVEIVAVNDPFVDAGAPGRGARACVCRLGSAGHALRGPRHAVLALLNDALADRPRLSQLRMKVIHAEYMACCLIKCAS